MAKKLFAAHPRKAEGLQAIRDGATLEEIIKEFGVSITTAKRWVLEASGVAAAAEAKDTRTKPSTTGGDFAAVRSLKPAPVIFELGEQKIPLDPQELYEAYILYEDLKVKCELTDGFTSTVRDGVALLWQLLVPRPEIEKGKVITEV